MAEIGEKMGELDDYFMAVAFLSAKHSKDPNTQVGAVIVDPDERVVGIGYNTMPHGCDGKFPWDKTTESKGCDAKLLTKYLYVCHAELNAILNKSSAHVRGCKIYVSLFPCNECAKAIIQSGIKEVIYYSDEYKNNVEFKASRLMLEGASVPYRQFTPKQIQYEIHFDPINQNKTIENSNW